MRTLFCAAVLALSMGARAESMGSLTGVVVDALTQAPVAGALVTARSGALVGEQTAVTDDTGTFEMTLLPSGTYDLMIKRDGFVPFAPGGLPLKGHHVRVRLAILAQEKKVAPGESAIDFNDSMTPPTMVSGPNPEYTQDAVERGIEGTMQVRCVVTVSGAVRNCKILKGLPYMNTAVVDALQARRYKPAQAAGKPVDVFYTFTVRLKLPAQ